MAKRAMNIFPGLAAQMAYKYHDNYKLAQILCISYDSILRRLSGEIQFELSEIKKLMKEYNASFDALFSNEGQCQKGA
jgi:hypothetical protein